MQQNNKLKQEDMVYTVLNVEIEKVPTLVAFSDEKRDEAMQWLVEQGVSVSNDDLDEYYENYNMVMFNIYGVLPLSGNGVYGLYESDEDGIVEQDIIPFDIEIVKKRFGVEDVSERIKENEITLCDNENEYATCWCHKINKLFA